MSAPKFSFGLNDLGSERLITIKRLARLNVTEERTLISEEEASDGLQNIALQIMVVNEKNCVVEKGPYLHIIVSPPDNMVV
ncbi:unnamed protein product [Linum trigynum]|uniref:Uncharacterized protein n=1 Tax=Linum trigynum TaxID=586398 RepID=A0AAV2EWZ2_9ROSI